MTKQEYEKIIKIIDDNMSVSHENPNAPRLVLTQSGFHNVKIKLKEMIKGE